VETMQHLDVVGAVRQQAALVLADVRPLAGGHAMKAAPLAVRPTGRDAAAELPARPGGLN